MTQFFNEEFDLHEIHIKLKKCGLYKGIYLPGYQNTEIHYMKFECLRKFFLAGLISQ